MTGAIVIVGAGQAGLQAAASLRQLGYAGEVTLIGDEPLLPYQRPPLSKTYLGDVSDPAKLLLRGLPFFEKNRIVVRTHEAVRAIDRARQVVRTDEGEHRYDHLILATGADSRSLPAPGRNLDGIFTLRTAADAECIRSSLKQARSMLVIGGGLIGLEMAAMANARGLHVTVVELAAQLAARTASSELSECLLRWHSADGIAFRLRDAVDEFIGDGGKLRALRLVSGSEIEVDLAIVSIGATPNVRLAAEAGLEIADGIVVNEFLQTSDPVISAIGDCARFRYRGMSDGIRLESVANAIEQGRYVASRSLGEERAFDFLPWSWSDQGTVKIQSAGWPLDRAEVVVEKWGDAQKREVCFCAIRDERLVGVDCVNRPAMFARARKIMMAPGPVDLDALDG